MTTRIDDIGLRQKTSIINLYEFQMDDQMALRLLLGKDVKDVNVDTYTYELIKELEYLPLAIDLAGATLRIDKTLTPELYLKKCKNSVACLEYERLTPARIQTLTGSTYGMTILTVWRDTLEHIRRQDPMAANLLQSIALFYPDNIPLTFIYSHTSTI